MISLKIDITDADYAKIEKALAEKGLIEGMAHGIASIALTAVPKTMIETVLVKAVNSNEDRIKSAFRDKLSEYGISEDSIHITAATE